MKWLKDGAKLPIRQVMDGRERSGFSRVRKLYSVRLLLLLTAILPIIGLAYFVGSAHFERSDRVTEASDFAARVELWAELGELSLLLRADGYVESVQAEVVPTGLDLRQLGEILGPDFELDSIHIARRLSDESIERWDFGSDENERLLGSLAADIDTALSSVGELRAAADAGESSFIETDEAYNAILSLIDLAREATRPGSGVVPSQLRATLSDLNALEQLSLMLESEMAEIWLVAHVGSPIPGRPDRPDDLLQLTQTLAARDIHRDLFIESASAPVFALWGSAQDSSVARRFEAMRGDVPLVLGLVDGEAMAQDFDSTNYGELGYLTLVEEARLLTGISDLISGEIDTAIAQLESDQQRELLVSIAIVLASLLIGAVAARQILRPLFRLQDRATGISAGNLRTVPLGRGGPSEIGDVSVAMDSMSATLSLVEAQLRELGRGEDVTTVQTVPGGLGRSVLRGVERVQTLQRTIREQAQIDPLTGLANRSVIMDEIDRRVAETGPHGLAVMVADLDRFKGVNDTHGHIAGDLVLQLITSRLAQTIEGFDARIGRMGGDEFLIVASVDGEAEARRLARRLVESLVDPVKSEAGVFDLDISVGIAIGSDGATGETLLRDADLAVYATKRSQESITICSEAIRNEELASRAMAVDLEAAIANQDLQLHLQPVVDIETGQVVSAEALCRWTHQGTAVSPDRFITVAESGPLILDLDRYVIAEGVRLAAQIASHGFDVPVAVNVSWRHFAYGDLLGDVRAALRAHGSTQPNLRLEFTESIQPDDVDVACDTLSQLRELGVGLSLDDFGTGYSSITHLRRFPFDTVKLDRSLATDSKDPNGRALLRAVIEMSRSLGLQVVAEGIEKQPEADAVWSMGCKLGQGWLWSRALSVNDFVEFLREAETAKASATN